MRFLRCVLFCVLVIIFVTTSNDAARVKRIVGGNPAPSPPPPGSINFKDDNPPVNSPRPTTTTTLEPDFESNDNDVLVFTKRGSRRAEVRGTKEDDGLYSFKGIRYAQAPEGRLRFQRPLRQHLTGKITATKYGSPCPQPLPNNRGVIGKEDCLFLNIFTPKIPTRGEKKGSGLPVIFWIHGGGFRRGSGSQYGPKRLVAKGVVVVTIQYRLGSLGFLSQKTKDQPGNVGLFDMNAALKWVKEYIRFFGGNGKNIIPSGQGSGASAASMLAMSKFNADGIRGVFAMSGSSVSSFATDYNETTTSSEVAELNSCRERDGIKFIRCMQKVPYEKIVEADSQLQENRIQEGGGVKSIGAPLNPSPCVEGEEDGRFLPHFMILPPIDALKSGTFVTVPLLTGVTMEETSTAAKGGVLDNILNTISKTTDVAKNLLLVNTGLFTNGSVNPSLNTLFNSPAYLNAVTNSLTSTVSQAEKLIEVTTDAIFNLPAYLTSQLWSKKSNAYLYQFNHQSGKTTGKQFLDGLPLVQTDDNKPNDGVSHGDDLVYLFDPQTIDGDPIDGAGVSSDSDKKVQEHFTTMVAEFARSGRPQIQEAGITNWNPFKDENSDYLSLSETPTVKTGFRKCQMALWAGLGEVLKSTECAALNAGELVTQLTGGLSSGLLDTTVLKNVGSTLTEPVNGLTSGLGNVAKDTTSLLTNPLGDTVGSLGGLLGGGGGGGGGTTNKQNQQKPSKNPLGSLFG